MVRTPRKPCKPTALGIRRGQSQLTGSQALQPKLQLNKGPEWESNASESGWVPAGNQRGQIKYVTAGTQVRRRANTCTCLLPRSIVHSAFVSTSAGLDSRGFLIGQADPADTVTSPPVVHGDIPLPGGGGCARKAGLVLNKGLGAGQLLGWALGAYHDPYRWSPPPSRLCSIPNRWAVTGSRELTSSLQGPTPRPPGVQS